jgi:hypothetical protein
VNYPWTLPYKSYPFDPLSPYQTHQGDRAIAQANHRKPFSKNFLDGESTQVHRFNMSIDDCRLQFVSAAD